MTGNGGSALSAMPARIGAGLRDSSFWLGLACGAVAPMAVLGKAGVMLPTLLAASLALWQFRRTEIRARTLGFLRQPFLLMGGLTFALWLVSVLLSPDSAKPAIAWGRSLGFALVWICIAAVLAGDTRARRITWRCFIACAFGAGIFATLGIYLFSALAAAPVSFKAFASVACMMAPLLLWSARRTGGLWRGAAVAALLIGLAVIWSDGDARFSRSAVGGLIGAVLLPFVILALVRLSFRWRCVALCGLVAAGAVAAAVVLDQLPRPGIAAAEQQIITLPLPDLHRQVIWGSVLDKGLLRPWFGWGLNNIDHIAAAGGAGLATFPTYAPEHPWYDLDSWTHPHNWVLEIFAETGLIGLAAFCGTIALALTALGRRAQTDGGYATWAALGLIGAFLASSLANFSFWSAWWLIAFMSLLTLVVSEILNPSSSNPDASGQKMPPV